MFSAAPVTAMSQYLAENGAKKMKEILHHFKLFK